MDSQADDNEEGENVRPRSRKRTRNPENWKASIEKRKVQSGEEHVTKSGRIIPAKIFSGQVLCKCRFKCHEKIDILTQKLVFQRYYDFECWSKKIKFLRSIIERCTVKENLDPKFNLKPRKFISKYYLEDEEGKKHQVCCSFLTKILQINRVTLFRAAKSKEKNPSAMERRGLYPTRKTDARSVQFVKTFIRKFPSFESHRESKYLHPRLNLKKMYEIYVEDCEEKEKLPVKSPIFQRIFTQNFNLCFAKRTKKCKTCDSIDSQLNSMVLSMRAKKKLKRQKKKHIQAVRAVKSNFLSCVNEVTDGLKSDEVYTFAVEKFEVPFVDNVNILKLRPLWCYNLCFYDEIRKKIFIYLWDESIAPCGTQEIGSCIYRHLYNNTPEEANKIVLFCDPCDGQMQNIKMVMMFQNYLINHANPNLEEMEHRYTIPGHSRNRCVFIFASLRRKRKELGNIHSPEHWADVLMDVARENKNITIVKMKRENFFNIKQLEALIVKPVSNFKRIWPNIRSVIYRRDEPFTLKTKKCSDDDSPITLHPLITTTCPSDEFPSIILPSLDGKSNLISKAKYDDLIESLNYIEDQTHHTFYKSLEFSTSDETDKDYGLALRESSDDENKSS